MNLFIANCTPQKHLFFYRVPEVNQLLSKEIPAGAQVVIENIPRDVANGIVAQYEKYGIVEGSRVKKGCRSLIYQHDKPISESQIKRAMEERRENLIEIAEESRDYTTASFYHETQKHLIEKGFDAEVPQVEVEIEGIPVDRSTASKTSQKIRANS